MSKHQNPALFYKDSNLARIDASGLQPGMYVHKLDRSWLDSPFLFQGFVLDNWDDVHAVQDICKWVIIDIKRQVKIDRPERAISSSSCASTTLTTTKPVPAERELKRANRAFQHTSKLILDTIDGIQLGKSIDTPLAKEAVAECVDSIICAPDAMLMLTQLKDKDLYTSQHSLNVAILSIAFGRALGIERTKLEELGLCGMFHDMGKVLTPDKILNKKGRFTGEELAIMKQHPANGREIIVSSGGFFSGAVDVAYGHHEWLNGTGYPNKRYDHQLTTWTKIVAITDAFDAITSARVYKKGHSNMEAFRILNKERGTHFDSRLVMKFISAIGIYAPGSSVLLNTGEAGVVIETNPRSALKPKVLILRDKAAQPVTPRLLNLSDPQITASNGQPYRVIRMLKENEYGINLHDLLKTGYAGDQVS